MSGPRCVALGPASDAPADLLERFAASPAAERFYWERPASGEALVAEGVAAAVESAGRERFGALRRELAALGASLAVERAPGAPEEAAPLLVGGFAFGAEALRSERWAGFPPARLVLPERLVARLGGRAFELRAGAAVRDPVAERSFGLDPRGGSGAAFAAASDPRGGARRAFAGGAGARDDGRAPGAAPPRLAARPDVAPEAWLALARRALAEIRAGRLAKLVLARSCTVVSDAPVDAARALRRLRAAHPSCVVFAVARGGACWLGATPERLLRVRGDAVRADAVAGTAPRGRTPEEDAALARALRESKKDFEEHAAVVRALRAALAPRCADLAAPEAPALLATEGVQHLHTAFEGRLRAPGGTPLWELAEALHPTPAVGGEPRPEALAWLRAHEGLDRGWYAGAVGWTTPGGEGELAVALRSALLRGREAALFAGAGLVAASEPERELEETRLKLRSTLGALLEL